MSQIYEFDTFRLNTKKRILTCNNEIISIRPKTFDLLLILLQNQGQIILKDNLVENIWGNIAVSDDSLTQQVSCLRRILGDSIQNPKYIKTVSGKGYKFIGEVRQTNSEKINDFSESNIMLFVFVVKQQSPPAIFVPKALRTISSVAIKS